MGTPLASDRAAGYVAECIAPQLEAGRHPVKRELGDRVTVAADIFRHGHAAVEPRLLFRLTGGRAPWREVPMESEGNDRFHASFDLDALGTWEFTFSLDGERWQARWPVLCERVRARFGSWYEMFPRSQGTDPARGATLREAEARLDEIAAMGFDVVYLPPIHPIGHSHRKGPNNSLTAGPDDPGSPYAIGSEAGGHDAIEPGLGTLADFDHFVAETERRGMEIALDFALNCSPDHPYVREHPDWFFHRPDGTIQYAENPPKKYEDIYPLNFEGPAREAIAKELLRVLTFWASHGVRIFRVDNPHTKPMALWERLMAGVRTQYPDVIFLSEAFTRPKPMKHLAKLGFSQSYTYFTWRNQKEELRAYAEELALGPSREYFRPNFFVNTPDILPQVLQTGGRAAFLMRLVLAATLAPNYGMYSGFELCEGRAVPGTEEYLDSEKY
ncbi:MAG TPA: maltotransferase domain-containing protein, partial [Terriglobales bacterium]